MSTDECASSEQYTRSEWNIGTSRQPFRSHAGDSCLARGNECVQRPDRGRVVDHALEGIGKSDQLTQPAERDFLELGRRGRRPPEHRLLIERCGEKFGQDARRAGGDREIGEESWMIPVREARHEQTLEVGHDGLEGFRVFRRRGRQRRFDRPRLEARKHGVFFGMIEVLGDPLNQPVAVTPERV